MASNITPGTAVAATLGIASSAYVSGSIYALSAITIPALVASPPEASAALLAKQWAAIYYLGRAINPRISVLACVGYGYLGYQAYRTSSSSSQAAGEKQKASSRVRSGVAATAPWVAAAVLTIGIAPYTFAFMARTNDQLLAVADGGVRATRESVEVLMEWWGVLNFGRGMLPLTGALVGAWGLFGGLMS